MYIHQLIWELFSYVEINHDNTSSEAKDVANVLSQAAYKISLQSKKIVVLLGGLVYCLFQDECVYGEPFGLKPLVRSAIQDAEGIISGEDELLQTMTKIGKKIIDTLPGSLTGKLFTQTAPYFFPKLNANIHKLETLLHFCLEHRDNLDLQLDVKLLAPMVPVKPVHDVADFFDSDESSIDTNNIDLSNSSIDDFMFYDLSELQNDPPCLSNLSMEVLGLFIAAAGIATIALAFTIFNPAVLGIAVGLGAVTLLAGVGFFCRGLYKDCQQTETELTAESFYPV